MMRATIRASDLAAAMKHSLAPRSSTLPILNHALLIARDDRLSITTTDVSAMCTVDIPADVEESDSIACDAVKLAAAASLSDELRIVEAPNEALRVHGAGRSVLRIPTLPPDGFPSRDDRKWESIAISATDLRAAIEAVSYAAPKADVRYYLNAVHIRKGWAEAGDGKVIAMAPSSFDGPGMIVPIAYVPSILRLLDDGAEAFVALNGSNKPCMLKVRGYGDSFISLAVPLSDGNYPDFDRLKAGLVDDGATLSVDRASMRRAVTSIRPFADDRTKTKPAVLAWGKDGASIKTSDGSEVLIDGAEVTGETSIGFRLDHFGDFLSASDAERITLSIVLQGKQRAIRVDEAGRMHCLAEQTI